MAHREALRRVYERAVVAHLLGASLVTEAEKARLRAAQTLAQTEVLREVARRLRAEQRLMRAVLELEPRDE